MVNGKAPLDLLVSLAFYRFSTRTWVVGVMFFRVIYIKQGTHLHAFQKGSSIEGGTKTIELWGRWGKRLRCPFPVSASDRLWFWLSTCRTKKDEMT